MGGKAYPRGQASGLSLAKLGGTKIVARESAAGGLDESGDVGLERMAGETAEHGATGERQSVCAAISAEWCDGQAWVSTGLVKSQGMTPWQAHYDKTPIV